MTTRITVGARVRHCLQVDREGRVVRVWEGDADTLPRAQVQWSDGRTETHTLGELEALPAFAAQEAL